LSPKSYSALHILIIRLEGRLLPNTGFTLRPCSRVRL